MRPMSEYVEAYAVPGEHSIIDVIDPETGLTACMGNTPEQLRERYPNAIRINLDEWSKQRAAEQDSPIRWTETTHRKYMEMLEILPPALWIGGAFLVGEPTDHHATTGRPRFQAYREVGSDSTGYRYFASSRPITCAELRAIVSGVSRV